MRLWACLVLVIGISATSCKEKGLKACSLSLPDVSYFENQVGGDFTISDAKVVRARRIKEKDGTLLWLEMVLMSTDGEGHWVLSIWSTITQTWKLHAVDDFPLPLDVYDHAPTDADVDAFVARRGWNATGGALHREDLQCDR